MIGILDYGMGNLRSVEKALQRVGADARVVADAEALAGCDRLVLPGVGAFGDGMQHLREAGFVQAIRDYHATGRPLLGICLGMQLLFDASEEGAADTTQPVPGLGLLPGSVQRFHEDQGPGKPRLKVPHMGWNSIDFAPDCPLFTGLTPGDHVYFVHAYYCQPGEPAHCAATTGYGQAFCAAVHRDNLWATQFHPEKSQHVGLQILNNFASST
ncbi:MAG: imidazole glycerol phosphate synthase subunit HisH [Phycisphaerales bacterium JB063]